MALPIDFGNWAAGNQQSSQFDTQFSAVGALTVIPCSASGINVIALTPNSNTPTQLAYSNYQLYGFVAPNTSTGSVTANVSAIGALNVYFPDGVTQVGANGIVSGIYYVMAYVSGIFQIISSQNLPLVAGSSITLTKTAAGLSIASTPTGSTLPPNYSYAALAGSVN